MLRPFFVSTRDLLTGRPAIDPVDRDPLRPRPNTSADLLTGRPAIDPIFADRGLPSASSFQPAPGRAPVEAQVGALVRDTDLGQRLAAAGAQSIELRMKGHQNAVEQTGIGWYFGDHSSFKTMTPEARAAWVEANKKPDTFPGVPRVAIDHVVENYRPTADQGTALDLSGLEKLSKVPFFFGLAKGGNHTFVGRNARVNEFHWNHMPNSATAIEERPLKDWGWNSGLIMIPPGTWPEP